MAAFRSSSSRSGIGIPTVHRIRIASATLRRAVGGRSSLNLNRGERPRRATTATPFLARARRGGPFVFWSFIGSTSVRCAITTVKGPARPEAVLDKPQALIGFSQAARRGRQEVARSEALGARRKPREKALKRCDLLERVEARAKGADAVKALAGALKRPMGYLHGGRSARVTPVAPGLDRARSGLLRMLPHSPKS